MFTFVMAYLTSLQQDVCLDRTHPPGVWELTAWPVKVAFFQLLAVFGLFMFSTSRRFAAPIPYVEAPRTQGEYVSSMADLLQRSGQRTLVLDSLSKQFHSELIRKTGHSPSATREDVLLTLEMQNPDLAEKVREIYDAEARLRNDGDSTNMIEMIRWARRISEIRQDWRRGS